MKKYQECDIPAMLDSQDEMVRVSIAKNKRWTPSDEQIGRGLSDISAKVRHAWVSRGDVHPNSDQMDAGLNDRSAHVRCGFILSGGPITIEQCDILMTDSSLMVRRSMGFVSGYSPTPQQFEKGAISDMDSLVRRIWVSREDFIPNEEQIWKIMGDLSASVRSGIATKKMKVTADMVECGLTDESWLVRLLCAGRSDIQPSEEQIRRGMSDESKIVSDKWISRMSEFIDTTLLDYNYDEKSI